MPASLEDFYTLAGPGKDASLCVVAYCRSKRGGNYSRLCHKHKLQKWRMENPEKYAYNNLKDSARKRRLPMTLSFPEFLSFVRDTGYMERKGNMAEDLQIDRIDATRGYEAGNLRVITTTENTVKGNKERRKAEYLESLLLRKGYDPQSPDPNIPF